MRSAVTRPIGWTPYCRATSRAMTVGAGKTAPKDQVYARSTVVDGRPVLRMMDPEYAATACLSCHGAPKGERDIAGMKKEGWKEGGLAGAISVILPLK